MMITPSLFKESITFLSSRGFGLFGCNSKSIFEDRKKRGLMTALCYYFCVVDNVSETQNSKNNFSIAVNGKINGYFIKDNPSNAELS